MIPVERPQEPPRRARDEQDRRDSQRLAEERAGMTVDACVIRWDDPDRRPWLG